MLQQVVLQTAVPMTLDIDSVDPDSIIVIESISGLDPADVTLFTGEFARDGGYYQGRRSASRNPVFNLKLNPNYADDIEVSDIREMLYDMFLEPSDTDELQVVLKDDRKPDRYFIGVTEKLPADIFTRESKAQVSMLCVDPFLKSVDVTTASDVVGWVSVPVTYEGSAKTGIEMTFEVKTATNTMNVDINGVKMTLVKPTGNFAVGDEIVINTVIGSRKITHEAVDVMAYLTAGSRWPLLRKGVNTIKSYGSVEADGKVVMVEYTYRAAWWGI
jgi:phage-related protein